MYRIAICDDQINICNQIRDILRIYGEKKNVELYIKIFSTGENLIQHMSEEKSCFNLLFLDIKLFEMNGINIGYIIRNHFHNESIHIVYISASQEYSMQLFKMRPMDFLLKPLQEKDIILCLSKAMELDNDTKGLFYFKTGHKVMVEKIREILYFESLYRKIQMNTATSKTEFYSNMRTVQEQLINYDFLICHHSYYVNYHHIIEFGKRSIIMSNQKLIPISRNYSKDFFQRVIDIENKIFAKGALYQ